MIGLHVMAAVAEVAALADHSAAPLFHPDFPEPGMWFQLLRAIETVMKQ
jgi:hypothetical protein